MKYVLKPRGLYVITELQQIQIQIDSVILTQKLQILLDSQIFFFAN